MEKAKDEKKRLINKGRRWFMSYLSTVTGDMSEKNRNQIMSVICSLYIRDMKTNEEFFNEVEAFCSERRVREEKNLFFRKIMNRYVEDSRLENAYAKKYPSEFRAKN